jgi:DNA-directed RNA polymerase subunit E"
MVKIKSRACKICKTIYQDAEKCPNCDSREFTDSYKGRIVVLNHEKSLIADKLNIKSEGNFAIKTR